MPRLKLDPGHLGGFDVLELDLAVDGENDALDGVFEILVEHAGRVQLAGVAEVFPAQVVVVDQGPL